MNLQAQMKRGMIAMGLCVALAGWAWTHPVAAEAQATQALHPAVSIAKQNASAAEGLRCAQKSARSVSFIRVSLAAPVQDVSAR